MTGKDINPFVYMVTMMAGLIVIAILVGSVINASEQRKLATDAKCQMLKEQPIEQPKKENDCVIQR